jgi:D-alanine-D-alanine ligase
MSSAHHERFGKVAVLMGGWSAEREVSLKSGNAVLTALESQGIHASGIDMGADVIDQLLTGRFDRAFIMVHGRGGEDGVIQGTLEILKIPYTGSGVLGASVCMDKLMTKRVWLGAGLPTPGFVELYENTDIDVIANSVGFPCIVKPALEGSSIGMSKVEAPQQLNGAWKLASQHGQPVLA